MFSDFRASHGVHAHVCGERQCVSRLSQLREYMLAQRVFAMYHADHCTPSAFSSRRKWDVCLGRGREACLYMLLGPRAYTSALCDCTRGCAHSIDSAVASARWSATARRQRGFAMLPPCIRRWSGASSRWTCCVCGRYRAGAAEE